MSNLSFRVDLDGSQAQSQANVLQTTFKRTGDVLRSELGAKLKTAFTVTAIEEVTRKTAQWANDLDRTSKSLGIPPEVLQSIQLLGRQANVADDATTTMFENISKARQDALAGNQDLIKSFGALGVTLNDLYNKAPSELFAETADKIKQAAGPGGISRSTDGNTRRYIQDVTSTPEGVLNSIIGKLPKAADGKSGLTKLKEQNPSQIATNEEIGKLSETWNAFTSQIKQLGTQLVPVVSFIVGLLNSLASALGGVVNLISSFIQGINNLVHGKFLAALGNMATMAAVIDNAVFSIIKLITFIPNVLANLLSHIPGLGGIKNKISTGVNAAQDWVNDKLEEGGADKNAKNQGSALGDVVAAIGTDGLAGGAKAGLTGIAGGAGKLGLSGVARNVIKARNSGILNPAAMSRLQRARMTAGYKAFNDAQNYRFQKFQMTYVGMENDEAAAFLNSPEERMFYAARDKKYGSYSAYKPNSTYLTKYGKANLAKNVIGGINSAKLLQPNNGPLDLPPILPRNSLFQDLGTAGGKTGISYGNAFASGFQSKIINLTEQMVRDLSVIAKNTTYNPHGLLTANTGNPNQTQTGTP